MLVAGIDYSMTSPALCLYDSERGDFNFDNCTFHYLTQTKKYEVDIKNIHGRLFEYKDDVTRYDVISSFFIDRLLESLDKVHVFIEGYSMGSKGKVFHIAENTGVLKYRLWNFHIAYESVPPTVIKKFATGKGNANKESMQASFEVENDVRIKELLGMTEKQWNPSSDLIDAYYICKYGYDKLTKPPI